MKYILVNDNGTLARYDSAIHGNKIPADAMEVSDEFYFQTIQQNDGFWIVDAQGKISKRTDNGPSPEQIEAQKVAIVQQHMDAAAQALRYDSITTAITYAEEPAVPKFQAEGRAFRAWRSQVWAVCYAILAEVEAGQRAVPTDEELIAALPELEINYD